MRSTSGQATIDYVAVVAVLAILLVLAVGAAPAGAAGIVNAVTGQIRHALCLVGGGPCADPRAKPCTVASTRDLRHFAVKVLLFRIDHDRSVLREEMSDGTVRLTVARSGALGAALAVGASAQVSVDGRPVGAKNQLEAAAQGAGGYAKVYVARNEREASAFMRELRDGRAPARPREVLYEGGVRGLAEAGIGSAWLEGLSGTTAGVRRDRRTGETTLTLNSGAAGFAAVTTALGAPAGAADRTATLGLTLDRDRRPTELSLSAGGTLAAGAALPLALKRALLGAKGNASLGELDGRRWELSARLSLHDPVVAAAWARFRRHPTSDAIRTLAQAIRDRASLDVRVLRTGSTASGGAAGVAAGIQLAGEYDHIVDEARLIGATSRPPAGLWERRYDCVPA